MLKTNKTPKTSYIHMPKTSKRRWKPAKDPENQQDTKNQLHDTCRKLVKDAENQSHIHVRNQPKMMKTSKRRTHPENQQKTLKISPIRWKPKIPKTSPVTTSRSLTVLYEVSAAQKAQQLVLSGPICAVAFKTKKLFSVIFHIKIVLLLVMNTNISSYTGVKC